MKFAAYALLAVSLLAACDSSTNPPGPPAGIVAVGNTSVVLTVGTTAADSLGVKVVDEDGRAVPNAQVSWTVDAPGGVTLSPATATTDAQGTARVAVQGGTAAGTRTVRAVIAGSSPAVTLPFTVTLNAGPAVTLQLPPSLITLTPGAAATLAVTAAADAFGNAVPTAGITWSSSNTSVADVSSTGAVTARGAGVATVTARLGQAAGVAQVRVLPLAINACETRTATLCSTWTYSNGQYNAQWQQGSQAVIRVERFDADSVRFARQDPSGSSAGLTAVYRGARGTAGVQNGVVTWTQNGSSFSGTWYGSW